MKKDNTINTESLNHPEGVEVKLSTQSGAMVALIWALVIFMLGTFFFIFIWGDFTAYNVGFNTGRFFSRNGLLPFLIPYLLVYLFVQGVTLYFMSGRKLKSLRWHLDWSGAGFSTAHPLALKYYRVVLLLPGILLGLLPALHGFCVGDPLVFYLGLYGIVCTSTDIAFWYKLRPFDDEDLLLAGKKSYIATIIKRNYSKN